MTLLARARERYRDAEVGARESLAPRKDERDGFRGGTRWMARALARTIDDEVAQRGSTLSILKYASALIGAAAGAALFSRIHPLAAPFGFAIVFYAIEVQGVFVLPCLVTGDRAPFTRSRDLVRRSGGTLRAIVRVIPIAAWMLLGALIRPAPYRFAFSRAWCEGCLAVVIWYEDVQKA